MTIEYYKIFCEKSSKVCTPTVLLNSTKIGTGTVLAQHLMIRFTEPFEKSIIFVKRDVTVYFISTKI